MWFEYRQNNSGGSFRFDKKKGISVYVWVEAEDAAAADKRAEDIGLYFNGCDSGCDCPCCGDRWYGKGGWCQDMGVEELPPFIEVYHEWARSDRSDGASEAYAHPLQGKFFAIPTVKRK